ncbi:hypothetical protein AB0H76_15140 [Nocardia sp. NPDC050712]|uniref:hypothetical protein n=1 Tax=Nocardia sp. NPDC050712 TaxID=3155518 RepID=UPI0033C26B32
MSETDEFDVTVDGYFAILPEWIIDADISDRAVRLYAVLRRFAGGDLKARPSRKKLAARLRTSLSSVDRALSELQAIGAVTVRHRWTNTSLSSFTYAKDSDHPMRAASRYILHSAPARRVAASGGVVTHDDTPVVTHDERVSSPVTEGVSSPMTRGVSSPVTHELKPDEPKKDQKISSSVKPPRKTEPRRDDVEALCARLRDGVRGNGSKATVTDAWRREARLLLDKDGHELGKCLNLIDWSQSNHFWRRNILSMAKFREQYDRLRLNALDEYERKTATPANGSTADQRVAQAQAAGAALAARMENEQKALMS